MLIPGIQGRWEYMRPTIAALARRFDVHTFSLRDDAVSLDDYARQVTAALDERGIERAIVCGVSFGGLVALRFAAACPERVHALVLASTPGPDFTLRRRHRVYARMPWIFGPLFLIESPWRLRREIAAALPDLRKRWSFRLSVLATLLRAPLSLAGMARRALLMGTDDLAADCERITAPTLVVTGERELDYVVPADGSAAYAGLIDGARTAVLDGTGHIGVITKPDEFADIVAQFVQSPIDRPSAILNPQYLGPDAA